MAERPDDLQHFVAECRDQFRDLHIATLKLEQSQGALAEKVQGFVNQLDECDHLLRVENGGPSLLSRMRTLEENLKLLHDRQAVTGGWWRGVLQGLAQQGIVAVVALLLAAWVFMALYGPRLAALPIAKP